MGFFQATVRLFDRNPVIGMSWIMGITGFSLPFIAPPIRDAIGLHTNNYYKVTHRQVAGKDYFYEDTKK